MQKKKKKLKRTSLTTRDFISARRSLSVYGPVIGPFHSRGPSSFFRRVGAVPSTIIISRHDDKRFVETVPLSLSLSRDIALAENSATLSGTKRLREWPRVHTGEENLSIVCLLLFFFFFFRPKTRCWVNRALLLSRCSPFYRDQSSGFISTSWKYLRASRFNDDRVDCRKRRRRFFFFFF